jgi:hypothetical protein
MIDTWPILPKGSDFPEEMIGIEEANEWRNHGISDCQEEYEIDESILVKVVHIDRQRYENRSEHPIDWQCNQALDKDASLPIGLGFIALVMAENADED